MKKYRITAKSAVLLAAGHGQIDSVPPTLRGVPHAGWMIDASEASRILAP
ncbi:MAG: hypothetical protein ABSC06_29225 [Rhodopila sp.]